MQDSLFLCRDAFPAFLSESWEAATALMALRAAAHLARTLTIVWFQGIVFPHTRHWPAMSWLLPVRKDVEDALTHLHSRGQICPVCYPAAAAAAGYVHANRTYTNRCEAFLRRCIVLSEMRFICATFLAVIESCVGRLLYGYVLSVRRCLVSLRCESFRLILFGDMLKVSERILLIIQKLRAVTKLCIIEPMRSPVCFSRYAVHCA